MSSTIQVDKETVRAPAPAWSAVYSMALCVLGLFAAEMLPISLLTPIAADLHITEGLAGQTVTATASVAFLASLLVALATRGIDRRHVLLSFSGLLAVSCLLVAFAADLPMLLLGRLLLGVAIGGFWAMSTATAMRLVPAADVPKALSVIFGAVALSSIVAAPLGSYFGALIGWRNIFLAAACLGVLAFIWQAAVLPSMAARSQASLGTLFHVLVRRQVWPGFVAVFVSFAAQFSFFTYLRPFLESVTHLGASGISGVLFALGTASFIGTSCSGRLLMQSLRWTLIAGPVAMGLAMAGLLLVGNIPWAATACLALWGAASATVPVGWSTWLTRTVPDEAETGGGLMVATIQLAIMTGAALGGFAIDMRGAPGALAVAVILFIAAAVTTVLALRTGSASKAA
jgi:predicted MFS family arabinose efflux permease